MSQRDLAAAAGVPQSTLAAAESGARSLQVAVLDRLLVAAGFRLAVLDTDGAELAPFDPRTVRDNAGRRFPAHLDAGYADVVDPYIARPRYDRPERRAGFEGRKARNLRRRREGTPARHVLEPEATLHALDRRNSRFAVYQAARPELLRRLGLVDDDDTDPDTDLQPGGNGAD